MWRRDPSYLGLVKDSKFGPAAVQVGPHAGNLPGMGAVRLWFCQAGTEVSPRAMNLKPSGGSPCLLDHRGEKDN